MMNVLITGATSGIGFETALLFATNGAHVWGASRNPIASPSNRIVFRRMDVTNEESVKKSVEEIWNEAVKTTGKGIDVVVHSAGYGIGGSAEDTPIDDAIAQFDTNYFGVLRVNRVLLPRMRAQGSGRVVILGSIAGRISIPFQSHYSATKFALEAYTEALRLEGGPFGLTATIIEAGDTNTAFTANRRLTIDPSSPYHDQALRSIARMARDEELGYPPTKVAKMIYKVSQMKNPPIRKPVGLSYSLLMLLKRLLPDSLAERIIKAMYMR
ncbi:MAG TPA: SDR family oxidoreductase [Sphaerochaeta sp.]|nr:SDR family oxidoreductase [Sphaerochaeta sp.]